MLLNAQANDQIQSTTSAGLNTIVNNNGFVCVPSFASAGDLPSTSTDHGAIATVGSNLYVNIAGTWKKILLTT